MKAGPFLINEALILSVVIIFLSVTFTQAQTQLDSTNVILNKIIEIETRQGVKQKFLLIKPENPTASLILFEGGRGKLDLYSSFGKPYVGAKVGTLLVRNIEDFVNSGFVIVLVDSPSDQQQGLNPMFRMSKKHSQDIQAVVSYLKKESDLPIWLVGISMGSFSIINMAVSINNGIDGFILLSGVTKPNKRLPKTIMDMSLGDITIPGMIMYNKEDQCPDTPPSSALLIKESLVKSPKVEVVLVNGGKNRPNTRIPGQSGCQPLTYHGFYGIEKQVISAIADFIKANSRE